MVTEMVKEEKAESGPVGKESARSRQGAWLGLLYLEHIASNRANGRLWKLPSIWPAALPSNMTVTVGLFGSLYLFKIGKSRS